jgi:hypothetical protein
MSGFRFEKSASPSHFGGKDAAAALVFARGEDFLEKSYDDLPRRAHRRNPGRRPKLRNFFKIDSVT